MREGRTALLPLVAVIFVDTAGYAIVVPIIPFALRSQGVSLLAVGAVFAAFSLCQFVTAPLLGRLSDQIGRRPVLALSQLGSIVGWVMLALSAAFPVVLLSRIVDGASAGNVAVCYSIVAESEDEEVRRRGLPALGAAGGAGILVGLGVSALLAGLGLAAAAVAAAALSLVSLLLTLVAVPATPHSGRTDLTIAAALRVPAVRRAGLFAGECAALQAAFFLTLPAYLSSTLGLRIQATTGIIAGLVAAAAVFQLIGLPPLIRRLGVRGAAWRLVAAALLAALVVGLLGNPPAVVAASAGFAAAAAGLAPVSALLLAESRRSAPMGLVMGLNASSATGGQIVGPIAGYAAFDLAGARGLGVGCLLIGLIAGAGLWGLHRG